MKNKNFDGAYLQRKAKLKDNVCAWALISPYIIIFVIFTLVPVVLGFVFSFMNYNPYLQEGNEFIFLQNYKDLFNMEVGVSRDFWNSFTTMLVFAIVAVPCLIIIPLALAYFVNMHPPGYKIYRAILYLPSVLSISVVGIIFSCMFQGDQSGLVNAWLGKTIKWMSGTPWNGDFLRWFVMLLVSIWWQTGTNFVILSGALRDVPKSLYEACEMDGGNRWQLITRVTLPNIKSSINICIFTTLIGYLNLFGQPHVLNSPENANIMVSPMQFIQKYLAGGTQYAKKTGYFCACAIVFGLFVMIFSIIQQWVTSDKKRIQKWAKRYVDYKNQKDYVANVNTEVQNG